MNNSATYRQKSGSRLNLLMIVLGLLLSLNGWTQNFVYVGGTLEGEHTWVSDSVYIVFQDIRIPPDAKLIIEPGTNVKIIQGRGILVNGILRAGNPDPQSDSVWFMSNSQKSSAAVWRWKGITFSETSFSDSCFLYHTSLKDAETGVELDNCDGITIAYGSFFGNQNSGITLINSEYCSVTGCNIAGNYNGIELYSTLLHKTSFNLISKNYISNDNHDIYMYRQEGGIMNDNVIEKNIIEKGNNGLWVDNAGEAGIERNIVSNNIFYNIGGQAGYALFISNDSIEVTGNIFHANHIAVYIEQTVKDLSIRNNGFYQNNTGIVLNRLTSNNVISNNTFQQQLNKTIIFREIDNNSFTGNNLFPATGLTAVVENETNHDGSIPQNYWNTLNDSIISQLIFDKNDNPVLGNLFYKPLLEQADTSNPPAPPFFVKKQRVNGQVKLSWTKSREPDIAGYNIYQGDFKKYAFPNKIDAGNDTLFLLPVDDINLKIAVTAYDSTQSGENLQLSGHESPFSFASGYPFAGNDKIICKYQTSFKLNESSIPFSTDTIFWFSSGDGTFDNENSLHPVYYPGQQDVDSGKVVLTIGITGENGNFLTDAMTVHIYDDPVPYAGTDSIIAQNDTIFLKQSHASNFFSVQWQTSGDGFFSNDTVLNPYYIPGLQDKENEKVSLYLLAFSECGFGSDTVTFQLLPVWQLSGSVKNITAGDNKIAITSFRKDNNNIKSCFQTGTLSNNTFIFNDLPEGNYLLYAVPDTSVFSNLLPVYYPNRLHWQKAHEIQFYGNTYDVDFLMIYGIENFPSGDGSILGHFILPADKTPFPTYFNSWFSENFEPLTDVTGMPNVTILLYDPSMKTPLKFTLTDKRGNFRFNRLPYGNYVVTAELAGYKPIPSEILTLTPDKKKISGLLLDINSNEKTVKISLTNESEKLEKPRLFPNPSMKSLNIFLRNFPHENKMSVEIIDLSGKTVISRILSMEKTGSKKLVLAKTDELQKGLYFVKITTKNNIYTYKWIKL